MARCGRAIALSRDFPCGRKQPSRVRLTRGSRPDFATSTYLARERDLLQPHVVVGLIPGGSSDVALCADLASLAHNHFDRRDLLRRRVTHNGARTGLATMAAEAPHPRLQKKFTDWPLCGISLRSISQGSTTRHRHDRAQTTRLFPRVRRHSGGRRRTIHHVGFERPTMNALTART